MAIAADGPPPFKPPEGHENPSGPWGFRVFVAGPTDCDEAYRPAVVEAVQQVQRYFHATPVYVKDLHWRVGADRLISMAANAPAQEEVTCQLGNPADAHIVVGLFRHTLGSGSTLEELETAQTADPPPCMFVFRSKHGPTPARGDDEHTTRERLDRWHELEPYLCTHIQGLKHEFDCSDDLKNQLINELKTYIERWTRWFSTRAHPPGPAPRSSRRWPVVFEVDLEAYEPRHRDSFFGREEDIETCRKRIVDDGDRALKVIGPSGAGKSSFVKAGLLPCLPTKEGPQWPSLVMRPLQDPFAALAQALVRNESADGGRFIQSARHALSEKDAQRFRDHLCRSAAHLTEFLAQALRERNAAARVVLYIDQYEELLVRHSSANVEQFNRAKRFVEFLCHLLGHDERFVVITTIRADRDVLNEHEPWRALDVLIDNTGGSYHLQAPSRGLRRLVEDALADGDFKIDPDLLGRLCSEVESAERDSRGRPVRQSSAFPLLSAALYELGQAWRGLPDDHEAKEQRRLTLDMYENEVEGLEGVVRRRAEKVFEWDPTLKDDELLTRLFLKLVRVDEHNRPVRRSQMHAAIEHDERMRQLVDLLIDHRILHTDKQSFELIADVTFTAWPKLRTWLEQVSDNRVLFELSELEYTADRWAARDEPDDLLINEERLPEIERLLQDADVLHHGPPAEGDMTNVERYVHRSRLRALARIATKGNALEAVTFARLADARPPRGDSNGESEPHRQSYDRYEKYYYAMFPQRLPGTAGVGTTAQKAQYSEDNPSPFQRAADPVRAAVADYFIKSDVEINESETDNTVAHYAAGAGQIKVLERLADLGCNFTRLANRTGELPLHWAVLGEHPDTVRWLLEQAQETNDLQSGAALRATLVNRQTAQGARPAHFAAYHGSADMLALLEAEGADLSSSWQGKTALDLAIESDDEERVRFAIDRMDGQAATASAQRWLCLAAAAGAPRALAALLENPDRSAEIDAPDAEGFTPLHRAAMGGHIGCLRVLVDASADINRGAGSNGESHTALTLALCKGQVHAAGYLLERGADPGRAGADGFNVLHGLAIGGINGDLVAQLAPYADPLAQDGDGDTPIGLAITCERESLARSLLASVREPHQSKALAVPLMRTALEKHYSELAAEIARRFGIASPWLEFRPDPLHPDRERLVRVDRATVRKRIREGLEAHRKTSFPIRPIAHATWQTLGPEQAADTIARLQPVVPEETTLRFNAYGAVRSLALPFYGDATLFEVSAYQDDRFVGVLEVIEHAGGVTLLNGLSRPIHRLNREVPLQLGNHTDVVLYLQLFCSSIQGTPEGSEGEAGPCVFRLVHGIEDLDFLARGELPAHLRERVKDYIRSPQIQAAPGSPSDVWRVSAVVNYASSLYLATFSVPSDGNVRMENDSMMLTGLPVDAERFEDNLRVTTPQIIKHAAKFVGPPEQFLRDVPLEEARGKPTYSRLAANLLRDAAGFFEKVADSNPRHAEQMRENAQVFRRVAELAEADPHERLSLQDADFTGQRAVGGEESAPAHAQLAAKLLRDAAEFFEALRSQNADLGPQMQEKAEVFRKVADHIEQDPDGTTN